MYIGEGPVTFIFLVNIYKLFTYWNENKILKGKPLPPKENSSNPLPWRLGVSIQVSVSGSCRVEVGVIRLNDSTLTRPVN